MVHVRTFSVRVSMAVAAAVWMAGSSCVMGAENHLSLDPMEASATIRQQRGDSSVLLISSAQTMPAGDAAAAAAQGQAEKLPPVVVPAQNKMAPGNLHLLPDTKELEQAPFRHTLFTGLIKDQSMYGKAWFPENLSNPEMDLDYAEGQLKYFTQQKKDHYKNEVSVIYEHAFNALTLEIELPYQWETEREDGETNTANGLAKVELGAWYPMFQYVSDDGVFDYTCVLAGEGGIPTLTSFSQDTELSPRQYQLIRIGDHFSIQTNLGAEFLIGPERGGTVNFIYGVSLGYAIFSDELPIPYVLSVIPLFEFTGEHVLTGEKEGGFSTSNFGTAGVRVNMKSFGPVQPRIGVGWVFPLGPGGREEMRYGIITSLIFEF